MPLTAQKIQVLQLLSQNLRNPSPQLVDSGLIANRLNISLSETHLLLKVMNDMGVVESNIDHGLSLITRKGLQFLEQQNAH